MQERFISLAENQHKAVLQVSKKTESAPKSVEDEDYRWTWLNPELENQADSAKPSDIKQAILQERTPELVAKPFIYLVSRINGVTSPTHSI